MPPPKKRKKSVETTRESSVESEIEEAAAIDLLYSRSDQRKAIESFGKVTLQRLLFDAIEHPAGVRKAVEAQFAARKAVEQKEPDSFGQFMEEVQEVWIHMRNHHTNDEWMDAFCVMSKVEDLLKATFEEGVTLASSYDTKCWAILRISELVDWILRPTGGTMGAIMKEQFAGPSDRLAETISHIIDVMTNEEVLRMKADEIAQEAIARMRRSELKHVREALNAVSSVVRLCRL
ncbi:hypothetical protein LTR17_011635 [Elasticomyces elasticus]|nr:hypothetical protein LTR17_011635 [Elasticomyces elasticus]